MVSKRAVRKTHTDPIGIEQIYTCPTCGNSILKNFCEICGEKKLQKHDFSFRHFAEETLEGFTHFDNKFFRTAWLLISKPGQLSVEFCEGRRVPYLKPFPMFIVCNILFFLLIGQTNIFTQPLSSFYHYKPYTSLKSREIIRSMVKSEEEFKTLSTAFNQKIGTESKAFLVIFIPILAIGSMAVNYRRRTYFSEHLVFSAHYFTFVVLLYTGLTLFITLPYLTWVKPEESAGTFKLVVTFIGIGILAAYFAMSSRRFYKTGRLRSIIGAIIIALVFMISLMAYRIFLFYKIIYSLQ